MLRFTIRDVLWLTVVVAFGVGWWRDAQIRQSEVAAARMKQAQAEQRSEALKTQAEEAIAEARQHYEKTLAKQLWELGRPLR